MKYHKYCKRDNCPDRDAKPMSLVVFMLVDHDPPTASDFRSKLERDTERGALRNAEDYDGDKCQACGLSVFTEIEDIIKLRNTVRYFKNKKVARKGLNETDGLVLPTPRNNNSHHTWWANTETDLLADCEVEQKI